MLIKNNNNNSRTLYLLVNNVMDLTYGFDCWCIKDVTMR